MTSSSYQIVDYNPRWPLQFRHEKVNIIAVLGIDSARVEHIGSTAVPRLGAKPIIDLMLGISTVPKLDRMEPHLEPLQGIGYEHRGIETVPGTVYLRKAHPRRYNLHVTKHGGEFWVELLLFRDYLRSHEDVAQRYEDLKRELIATLAQESDPPALARAYNDGKAAFISNVLEQDRAGMSFNGASLPEIDQTA